MCYIDKHAPLAEGRIYILLRIVKKKRFWCWSQWLWVWWESLLRLKIDVSGYIQIKVKEDELYRHVLVCCLGMLYEKGRHNSRPFNTIWKAIFVIPICLLSADALFPSVLPACALQ